MSFPAAASSGTGDCRIESHDVHNGKVKRYVVVNRLVDPVTPAAAEISVAACRYSDVIGE